MIDIVLLPSFSPIAIYGDFFSFFPLIININGKQSFPRGKLGFKPERVSYFFNCGTNNFQAVKI
jgi:hypothetical protein